MKSIAWFCVFCLVSYMSFSQQALPAKLFLTMRDSTTSIDIVLLKGEGGSISAEGGNVFLFNSFIENKTAKKTNASPSGNMMWLINGREFISGNYFLGDSTGYAVFQKDGKEYVNRMNEQGNVFFKSQLKN